jgi:hypothetical protein
MRDDDRALGDGGADPAEVVEGGDACFTRWLSLINSHRARISPVMTMALRGQNPLRFADEGGGLWNPMDRARVQQ